MSTPLSKVKNFGPVTLGEFEAMGLKTLEQVVALGFEDTCRRWVEYFPERLNANAFIGVVCSIDGTVWTSATAGQRTQAHRMVQLLRAEFGLPPPKPRKRALKN
jgi:hypothetical protein